AHRDAMVVALPGEVSLPAHVGREIEAPEQADDGTGSARGKGLAPLHGGKERVARVLLRPDPRQAAPVRLEPEEVGLVQDLARDGKARVAVPAGLGVLDAVAGARRAVV